MSIVPVFDATHANIGRLPAGQRNAGYTTGTPDIRWTGADWRSHPGAVRICQDSGSDHTADVLDDESGAATDTDAAIWVPQAQASYREARRPGQRWPAVYKSASGITALVNTLIAHGITRGVYLWVAHWGETDRQARAEVRSASGPFPVIGIQNHNLGSDDESWMSGDWLTNVSAAAGSHKHLTAPGDTLGSLADSRHMDVFSWLNLQRRLSAPQAVHLVRHAAPQPGSTWRSESP